MGLFGFSKKQADEVDYANINSLDRARDLAEQGKLERMYIISPSLFGGSEADDNALYVPLGVSKHKADMVDQKLVEWSQQGNEVALNCNPEYKGYSVVPSKITFILIRNGSQTVKITMPLW